LHIPCRAKRGQKEKKGRIRIVEHTRRLSRDKLEKKRKIIKLKRRLQFRMGLGTNRRKNKKKRKEREREREYLG
jgi:hypothetical protein